MSDDEPGRVPFDTVRPNLARVYDYWLGGKDNFAADRALGDQIVASLPAVRAGVRAQRALLGRVVYVDHDPVVLSHARAILADSPATIVIDGDLRSPAGILEHPDVASHLDWGQPIGLLLCGIVHHILYSEHPGRLVETLSRALPPGSYVFIHHLLDSGDPAIADVQAALQKGLGRGQFRTWAQIRGLFNGLELVEPGLVLVPEWRPDWNTPSARSNPVLRLACAGVARKA